MNDLEFMGLVGMSENVVKGVEKMRLLVERQGRALEIAKRALDRICDAAYERELCSGDDEKVLYFHRIGTVAQDLMEEAMGGRFSGWDGLNEGNCRAWSWFESYGKP